MKNSIYYFGLLMLILALTIAAILTPSCTKDNETEPTPPKVYERGDIKDINTIGTYTINDIQQRLNVSGLQAPFTLTHDVQVYSVNYYTVNKEGEQIITSGAFVIPQGINNLPMISMQHGTETKNDLVASVSPDNSVEGLISLMTASMGYFTVVADYPGFGVSTIMHPYIHANSIVPCVIDFIRAGKNYSSENNINLTDELFLTGYSEGGYISLVTQKEIEAEYSSELNLTAVAALAGPYDLKGMLDTIFQSSTYSTPAYIAYFITAYNHIYGWNRLDDIFQAPYAAQMPGLFNGSKTWGEIVNQLPPNLSGLLKADFIANYNNGGETDFRNAIVENTLMDWIPQTPIHFFHGDADDIVPIQNALTAINHLSVGSSVQIVLTAIPGGTHETAGPAAIIGSIEWIESF
jgi:pimeloyl-ACP methyl ester carboxylesterase